MLEKTESVSGSAATIKGGVPDKDPADKWWNWLKDHGINWVDKQTVGAWVEKNKGKNISLSAFKELVGNNIGVFTIILHPSSLKYDINFTETGWDGYIGDGDGKYNEAGDSVPMDKLMEKLDKTSLTAAMQNKTIWQLLESTRILWGDKIKSAESVKDDLEEFIDNRIDKDPTLKTEAKKIELKGKVRGYLDNIDSFGADPFTGRTSIKNTDLDGTLPYDYFGEDFEDPETLKCLGDICVLAKAWKGDAKSRANDMYALLHMRMIFGTGVSIQAVYDREALKHPGLLPAHNTYDTVANIYDNIRTLTKKAGDLEESIKAEEDKGASKNVKLYNELTESRDRNAELLRLSRKFDRFVCMFSKTGGKDYETFFAKEGYRPKDTSKQMTLKDCLHIFSDSREIMKHLTHKTAKAEENNKGAKQEERTTEQKLVEKKPGAIYGPAE
jgi:hypothetical protein